jgi:pyruvate dehydrogenase E1 component beta subunit
MSAEPLDIRTVLDSVGRTSRLLVVEENPYQGGWGAAVASLVAAECVPPPFADLLEDQVTRTVGKLTSAARRLAAY